VDEDEEGTVWHFVREPLAVGTRVEGQVDWGRRFDHMQQHTGQHLLSAIFWQELEASTISFHLGESTSTIDLTGGPFEQHSLERVERIANEIIGEDRPVTSGHVSHIEAETMLAAGQLRGLPDRVGAIRLIDIADCDKNACGGTHVRSTGQIGGLLIRTVEKVSRGVRVEFVCGLRAIRSARADFSILRQTSALLSAGATELVPTVGRVLAEAKSHAKERQKLREELAAFHAAQLVMEVPIENGLRMVVREWTDRDRDYIKLLALQTVKAAAQTIAIFSASDAHPIRIFVARSADLGFSCGQVLREALAQIGLRGGGSADLAQGDVPSEQEAALRVSIIDTMCRAVAKAHK
jgi:alanyl-tRNA synthetase